ncbi:MAG: sigma-70 family RNA polymerase sigma factor [Clostridiales bacterium]|nr:sigma-70 family RNA polymerase sigma factor [Clostridiales bacterium]
MTSPDVGKIYATYSGKVMRYIMTRVQRRAEAEDLCEDVFEKVLRRINDFDETKASVSTWIFTITRNTLIDHFRKFRPSEEISEEIPSDMSVETPMLERETLDELADALNRLDQEQRDIIVMLYYDKKPMTEIARLMNLSYGAVKIRHQKALSALRQYMG